MWELRASSYGGCLKGQVAGKLGYKPLPPSEVMQGYFDRGNDHEEECKAALIADGWVIAGEQQAVELYGCTGHLDGIISDGMAYVRSRHNSAPYQRVWEAKAPNAWAQFERAVKGMSVTPLAEKYLWQISLYMHAMGMEAMVSCVEDGRVKSFVIEVPPKTLEEVWARIDYLQAATALPEDCSAADYPCPWVYLHEKVAAPDNDIVTEQMILDYAAANAKVKELKEKLRKRTAGTSYDGQVGKVTYYPIAGRRTPDYAAMEADGVLDKYVKVGDTTVGMKITARETKGEDDGEGSQGS